MTAPDDRELRELFQAARRRELGSAPSMSRVTGARPRPTRVRYWALAAAAALALVLGVAVRAIRHDRNRAVAEEWALEPGQWRTPTDFLLEVPGGDLLRTVPSLGRVSDRYWSTGSALERGIGRSR